MKNSFVHHVSGVTARQARVAIPKGLKEQHISRSGFAGTTAMLYSTYVPNKVLRTEGTLRVSPYMAVRAACEDADSERGMPTKLLYNDACAIYISRRSRPMPYAFRNVDADLLYFVHAGTGTIATEYGPLSYRPGDFIYLPKGTAFRHMPDGADGVFVITESIPEIHFTEHAQVGRHAPFDPTVVDVPEVVPYDWPEQDEWEVLIKHGDEFTRCWYAQNPLQMEGWKGDCFPHRLNMEDIRPIMSERLHLAPSAWAVYESAAFVYVAYLRRSIESDPEAEAMPDYHRNVDTDEAVFMHECFGFGAPGILLHQPQGITHSPPEEVREAFEKIRKPGMQSGMVGISLDTFARLKPTPELVKVRIGG